MHYVQYPYTANFDEVATNEQFGPYLRESQVLGHIRFMYSGETIHELMYLQNSSGFFKLEWHESDSNDEIYVDEIVDTDMDPDENYYTIVYDIKETCTETPEIDELLIMHDEVGIWENMWEYIRNIYAQVYWTQDTLIAIPNYVSGFIRNMRYTDAVYCAGDASRIPLLSAMLYSHGVAAITNMLDNVDNCECLLDIADESAPLFAFWNMLEGPIRKKIWDMFDILDYYYDENYQILLLGPKHHDKCLLQIILEDAFYTNAAEMAQIYNYIAEVRDPDWFTPVCTYCNTVIYGLNLNLYQTHTICAPCLGLREYRGNIV